MLLGLLSVIWLKLLQNRKISKCFFIKSQKGGDVGNPQDPQRLLEKSRVTVAFVQQP
jgi:hypothetical protein